MSNNYDVRASVQAALGDPAMTPLARAELVVDVVRQVYDHVKFHAPEGGGLDGRDGPERLGLGDVLNAAINHHDTLRAGWL